MVSLYDAHEAAGFTVLAFPCRQFGGQEKKTEPEIRAFVDKYGVRFPMFAPVDVNGSKAHPLFGQLLNPSSNISWNFAGKFLTDKQGRLVKRYDARTPTETIDADIRALLAA